MYCDSDAEGCDAAPSAWCATLQIRYENALLKIVIALVLRYNLYTHTHVMIGKDKKESLLIGQSDQPGSFRIAACNRSNSSVSYDALSKRYLTHKLNRKEMPINSVFLCNI